MEDKIGGSAPGEIMTSSGINDKLLSGSTGTKQAPDRLAASQLMALSAAGLVPVGSGLT